MEDHKLPWQYRDACADILIPLNVCRRALQYRPWRCVDLRHAYESCQFDRYNKRVEAHQKAKLEKKLGKSLSD
eukprot:1378587-Amorphochlora_amoeboformis.AAC.1